MPGRQRPYLDEASTWGKGTGTHGSRAHSSCRSHGWKTGHEAPESSTSLGTPCLLGDSLVNVQLSGLAGLSEGWENGRLVQDSAGRRRCTQGERRSVCRERWAGPRQLTRDAGVLQDQPQGTRSPSCLGPEDRGAGRRRPWNWRGPSRQGSDREGHSHCPNCRPSRGGRGRNTQMLRPPTGPEVRGQGTQATS